MLLTGTSREQCDALRKQVSGCASWFFWIAGMTLINAAMIHSGSDTSFLIGLTVSMVVDALAAQGGSLTKIFAIGFDAACIGALIFLGWKARSGRRWAFTVGLILYSMDTLLSLAAPNFISIALHGWALFSMGLGLRLAGKLSAAEAESALPPVLGQPALPPLLGASAAAPALGFQAKRIDKAAVEMEEMARLLYAPSYRYAPVDPKSFRSLDLGFYDATLRKLQSFGFRHLGDEENLDLKNTAQDPGCFTRVALGSDGTVMAALYQFRPKFWLRLLLRLTGTKLGKAVDFETEFSDGTVLCTSNAQLAATIQRPEEISSLFLPWETPVEQIYERHLQRVQERLRASSAVPKAFATLDDVHASQNRQQAMKALFRKNVGGFSREELLAHADTPEKMQAAEQLWQRLQQRRQNVSVPSPA
jgi:hypothetical protein